MHNTDPAPKWERHQMKLFLHFNMLETVDAADAVDNDDDDDEI